MNAAPERCALFSSSKKTKTKTKRNEIKLLCLLFFYSLHLFFRLEKFENKKGSRKVLTRDRIKRDYCFVLFFKILFTHIFYYFVLYSSFAALRLFKKRESFRRQVVNHVRCASTTSELSRKAQLTPGHFVEKLKFPHFFFF